MFIALKPLERAQAQRRPGDRPPARRSSPRVPGATLFLQAVQDLRIGGRLEQRAVPVHAAGRRPDGAERVGADACCASCARCPSSPTSTATSRTSGLRGVAGDRPRHRLAPGHHAADDRRHALRRLRPAPGLDDVHAAQPVPRRDGGGAAVLAEPRRAAATSTCSSSTGAQVPLSAVHPLRADRPRRWPSTTRASFPSVTLSFNLAPGRRAGRRGRRRSRPPSARSACRPTIHGTLPGHGAGVPGVAGERAAPDPRRAGRRLHRARHSLRELHPPDHDSLDAALGRRRRAPGAAALSAPTSSVIALIGIILLIGIVKKNAIMMIDFALEAERSEGKIAATTRSTRPACCASGPIMMTTMAALLGALPLALGTRHRLGAAPPARHRDRRRPDRQPAADALHDAGRLPVPRPLPPVGQPPAPAPAAPVGAGDGEAIVR